MKKELLQNKLILKMALENKNERFEFLELLNDNGLYCGAVGANDRLKKLNVEKQDKFIKHLLNDIEMHLSRTKA